jgi:hypothetical protein
MKTRNLTVLHVELTIVEWRRFLKWLPKARSLPLIYSNERWDPFTGGSLTSAYLEWGGLHQCHKKDTPKEAKRAEQWLAKFLNLPLGRLNKYDGLLFECFYIDARERPSL